MKTKSKIPALRFKGFTDAWEERKLAEFTTSFSGGTPSAGNSSYYKGDIPFIRSGEINSDKTELFLTEDGLKNSSAKMVSVGDILYALYGATSGEVGISQINGAINQAILAIRPIGGYSSHFIMQWLRLQKQKIIDKYLQGGQGNLSGSIIKNLILNVPNFEEQRKIGSFFKQLDDTITLHQRKLDLLKEQKKSFLQKMFPKNGEKVPELRFAGFADDWEQRKFFESIASTIDFRGRTPKKLGMDWSDSGYLALSALNVKNGYIDPLADAHYGDEKLYRKWMSGRELKKGQVLFTTEAPMGNVAQVPDDNGYILSQRTVAFETKEDMMTNDFLAVLLKSPLVFNNLSALSSGGTAKGVSQKSLKGLSITVPLDIDEQQKIGSFFKQLDDTITLHQRKLDLLKELKKALLRQLFV